MQQTGELRLLAALRSYGWGFLCYQALYVAAAFTIEHDLSGTGATPVAADILSGIGFFGPVPTAILGALFTLRPSTWKARATVILRGMAGAAIAIGLCAGFEQYVIVLLVFPMLIVWQVVAWSALGCAVLGSVLGRRRSQPSVLLAAGSLLGLGIMGAVLAVRKATGFPTFEAGTGETYGLGLLFITPVLLCTVVGSYGILPSFGRGRSRPSKQCAGTEERGSIPDGTRDE